jgi:hypothetical protein
LKGTGGHKGFNYPMFLSGLGGLTTTLTSYLIVRVFKVVRLQHERKINWAFYRSNLVPIGRNLWEANNSCMAYHTAA